MKGVLAMQSGKSEDGKCLRPGQGRLDDVNGENFALVWTRRNVRTGFIEQSVIDGYADMSGCLSEIREWWDMSELRDDGLELMRVEAVLPGGSALLPFDRFNQKRTVSYYFKINGNDMMALYPEADTPLAFSTMYFGDATSMAVMWVEYSMGYTVEVWRVDDTSQIHVCTMARKQRDGRSYYSPEYTDAVDDGNEIEIANLGEE